MSELDEAWQAAVAALPEGWIIAAIELDLWSMTDDDMDDQYFALARERRGPGTVETDLEDSPAAALHALTKLFDKPIAGTPHE